MSRFLMLLLVLFMANAGFGQYTVFDLKVKTAANSADRTKMLDILRAKMYEEYKQEFVFVVDHFKMSNNYAWFMGDVQRKDGRKIVFPDDGVYDCCHAQALFRKKSGKWYLVESGSFATDVWFEGIEDRYPSAPAEIFGW